MTESKGSHVLLRPTSPESVDQIPLYPVRTDAHKDMFIQVKQRPNTINMSKTLLYADVSNF